MKDSERTFYEIPTNWENLRLTPVFQEKIRVLGSMIPEGTHRILDLGCGNGIITNAIATDHTVVGVDWSRKALESVQAHRVCSSSAALSLRPGSFDLLLCSELLEHLLEDDFRRTISEIRGLEIPRLLITVPNNENIHLNEVKCSRCRHVFNVSHHNRSFSARSLASHFPDYEIVASRVGGVPVRAYPLPLLRLRQRLGGRWYQLEEGRTTMCPRCRSTDFPRSRYNPLSLICDGVNKVISRRRPYWLYVLLERR